MPNPFHATYNFVAWTLDQGHVPSDVRRSLELVRTCDRDLQHLVELRNECLARLERRPLVLARVHSVIEAARAGLDEACAVVERLRPGTHGGGGGGGVPLASRVAWVLVDSAEFRSLEPVVGRHHDAVLAELNFLRSIAMLAPVPEAVQRETPVFDNVALLGDILGDLSVDGKPLPPIPSSPTPAPASPHPVTLSQHRGYHQVEPPSSLMPPSTRRIGLAPDSSAPEILPMSVNRSAPSRPQQALMNAGYISEDMTGLANLLGDTLVSPGAITPVQTGSNHHHHPSLYNASDNVSDVGLDRSQRASIGYTPSVSSFASQSPPPPLNNRASASTLPPIYTYGVTQHQNTSSTTLPARFAWVNTSSATISSLPQTLARSMDGTGWGQQQQQPIAELDSSPYQMVPVVRPAGGDGKNPVVQFVKQLNTIPVELSAGADSNNSFSVERS